ncbi:hypothetical protein B0J13DRAFT_566309 [Dactylonectria estremocensis]|uniref:NACHT-NTPase and P-loop NTPases N-terminal domain-containing protein n=1 Tax=Dactylonectria estremocensis TaxID=1079267 RepID=A0A9P9DQ50_9HYPO|nr:hypothetical protein B0J13DRAFT_566309 [Dactylonectria estremocensis]
MVSPSAKKLIKAIEKLIGPIDRAIRDQDDVAEGIKLPEAFPAVASYLPLVTKIFSSITSHLQTKTASEETEDDKERYAEIKEAVEELSPLTARLEDLFDTTTSEESSDWLDRYKAAVDDGDRLEIVMRNLLSGIREFAKVPFVSADEINELKEALKVVKALPASLADDNGGSHSFVNSGSGIMGIHLGRGEQNWNTSTGFQVTGKGSHVNYNNGVPPA